MENKEKERKKNISDLGDMSIETSQNGNKRKKNKNGTENPQSGTITKGVTYMK